MIMLMAFVLGLVVPGGLLFLRDTMNHTVRGRKDLDNLGVPLVGEVPDISIRKHWWSRRNPVKREVVVKADSRDLINESLRIVRTNLDYFIKTHSAGNVVMLTSFNPASGKSFITPNLAKEAMSNCCISFPYTTLRHDPMPVCPSIQHAQRKSSRRHIP